MSANSETVTVRIFAKQTSSTRMSTIFGIGEPLQNLDALKFVPKLSTGQLNGSKESQNWRTNEGGKNRWMLNTRNVQPFTYCFPLFAICTCCCYFYMCRLPSYVWAILTYLLSIFFLQLSFRPMLKFKLIVLNEKTEVASVTDNGKAFHVLGMLQS